MNDPIEIVNINGKDRKFRRSELRRGVKVGDGLVFGCFCQHKISDRRYRRGFRYCDRPAYAWPVFDYCKEHINSHL